MPTESELIESLFVTRSNQSFSRRRSLSFDGGSGGSDEPAENPFEGRWKQKARPVAVPPGMAKDDSSDDDSYALATLAKPASHAAQRPKLETIPSTDAASGSNRDLTVRKSKRSKSRRSKLMATVGSPVGDDTE
ncbi:hypothetical protein PWT90_11082 [Aphanocladium album]|nr:hypothetical protein PWT90_11082 [Aphanocladium album]